MLCMARGKDIWLGPRKNSDPPPPVVESDASRELKKAHEVALLVEISIALRRRIVDIIGPMMMRFPEETANPVESSIPEEIIFVDEDSSYIDPEALASDLDAAIDGPVRMATNMGLPFKGGPPQSYWISRKGGEIRLLLSRTLPKRMNGHSDIEVSTAPSGFWRTPDDADSLAHDAAMCFPDDFFSDQEDRDPIIQVTKATSLGGLVDPAVDDLRRMRRKRK